jgi:hypothetical protein
MKVVKVINMVHPKFAGPGRVTDVRVEEMPIMLTPDQVWVDPRGNRWKPALDRPMWTNRPPGSYTVRFQSLTDIGTPQMAVGDELKLEAK